MRYLIFLFVFLLIFGCGDKQKIALLQKENSDLKTQFTELSDQSQQKDQFIEEFTNTLNEVYDNLERIRKKESIIGKFSQDIEKNINVSAKEKILDNIKSIESYLDESKQNLKRFKNENYQNLLKRTDLEKTVENLGKLLNEKEQEMAALKEEVTQLNIKVTSYVDSLHQTKEIIEQQTEKINSVYYVIGTENQLKKNGIIVEKGGILGIRKTKILAADFNQDLFQKTDINQIQQLAIGQNLDKIKIISPHDPNSYQLLNATENETILEITNPEEFWKIQYLVILTKG